jgi:predicted transcriptional regulator
VKRIHQLPVKELWSMTKEHAGISEDRFFEYFKGKDQGYAIEIGNVDRFAEPLSLKANYGVNPPQSFVYVEV